MTHGILPRPRPDAVALKIGRNCLEHFGISFLGRQDVGGATVIPNGTPVEEISSGRWQLNGFAIEMDNQLNEDDLTSDSSATGRQSFAQDTSNCKCKSFDLVVDLDGTSTDNVVIFHKLRNGGKVECHGFIAVETINGILSLNCDSDRSSLH